LGRTGKPSGDIEIRQAILGKFGISGERLRDSSAFDRMQVVIEAGCGQFLGHERAAVL
jgi:hypothetical protein